jgi:hypothetical protein
MNDPHVDVLVYRFIAVDDRHDYSQATPWGGKLGDFNSQLSGGKLTARPEDHYSDTDSAREALESHLNSWELWSELENGIRIKFQFESSQVVDRSPIPGSVTAHAVLAAAVGIASDVVVKVTHGEYPSPGPTVLATSELVQELLEWVRDIRERRQRLLVANYMVLTRLEYEYGGRKQAAAALNVAFKVLNTLGKLSEWNDPAERRKVKGPIRSLTEAQRQWLIAVPPRLTRQVAEIVSGSHPPQLTLADLPALSRDQL